MSGACGDGDVVTVESAIAVLHAHGFAATHQDGKLVAGTPNGQQTWKVADGGLRRKFVAAIANRCSIKIEEFYHAEFIPIAVEAGASN